MDFTKKELISICEYYFPEKTKTYFITTPK